MLLENKEYKEALYKQYMSAKGFQEVGREDQYIRQDLEEYFEGIRTERKNYLGLLRSLGVNYNEETAVEVGKGNIDSAVEYYNATIVTPFVGVFKNRRSPVYEGKYAVIDGDIEMESGPLEIPQGRIYLTHNMFEPKNIRGWLELLKNNDVVIGVYGSNDDKDKDTKIEHIDNIAAILDNRTYNYGTIDGYYFAAVRANQDAKILKKTLERINRNGRVR